MSDSLFKKLFECAPGLYLVLDTEFKIIAVTDAYLAATMTKRDQIIGKYCFDVFPDNPLDKTATGVTTVKSSFTRVLTEKKADTISIQKYDIPIPIEAGGGFEERYWSPANFPVFDDNNQVVYIIHRVEDVTEFIRLQEQGADINLLSTELKLYKNKMEQEIVLRTIERRKSVEELRLAKNRAEELAEAATVANLAKSDFLATMSHEIRTPLNGIIGMNELLLLTNLTTDQKDFSEAIRISSDILLDVINDILDFSKIESGHLELDATQFDFRNMVDNILEGLALSAHIKGLAVGGIIEEEVPSFVIGDELRLGQVLRNLLSNAIKFTEKGQVLLTVNILADDTVNTDSVKLYFEVSDTGIGMSEKVRSKLFQPFSQGDNSITRKYGGTGLGLIISKRIIEHMNGSISLKSTEGVGTTLTFTVILLRAKLHHPQKVANIISKLQGKLALIIDDNEINRKVLKSQLSSLSISSDSTDNPFDGITKIKNSVAKDKPYDFVFLDFFMPKMDGIETIAEIRSTPEIANTNIIMLTSIGLSDNLKELKKIGIKNHLAKPIRREKLLDVISTTISELDHNNASNNAPYATTTSKSKNTLSNILIVEDNIINQNVVSRMLKYFGLKFSQVTSGAQAIESIKKQNFALILMDCQMPGMDGYTTTKKIREIENYDQAPKNIIVAMTANAMKGDREKCIAAGMDDYLSKPLKIPELHAVLNKWLKIEDRVINTGILDVEKFKQIFQNEPENLKIFMDSFLANYKINLLELKDAVLANKLQEIPLLIHNLLGTSSHDADSQLYAQTKILDQQLKNNNKDLALATIAIIFKLLTALHKQEF